MSKRIIIAVLLVVAAYLVFPAASIQAQAKYVGVKVCGMCHKTEKSGNQLKIWQDSKHSHAYKSLLTPKADAMSKKGKAAENKDCLKCHVGSDALVAAFKDDGVQCETCHGAGSEYKAMNVMKNKADAKAKGLIMPEKSEKFCVTCHNKEMEGFKGFKFDEMWKKIAHATPKG